MIQLLIDMNLLATSLQLLNRTPPPLQHAFVHFFLPHNFQLTTSSVPIKINFDVSDTKYKRKFGHARLHSMCIKARFLFLKKDLFLLGCLMNTQATWKVFLAMFIYDAFTTL